MQRPIKFRVWIEDEKRFRYCDYVPTMGFVWELDGKRLEVGENYPDQYTGLKDIEGKEIYENDLVIDKLGCKYKVVWEKDNACISLENYSVPNLKDDFDCAAFVTSHEIGDYQIIVIGNTHENQI